MNLRDQSISTLTSVGGQNLLYVTSHEMFDGYFIPGPIELLMSVLDRNKVNSSRFSYLVGFNRFVKRPSNFQNIGICVDFGLYNIKRQ